MKIRTPIHSIAAELKFMKVLTFSEIEVDRIETNIDTELLGFTCCRLRFLWTMKVQETENWFRLIK